MSDVEKTRAEIQRLQIANRALAELPPDAAADEVKPGSDMAGLNERLRLVQIENQQLLEE